jgi:hypothetical protein
MGEGGVTKRLGLYRVSVLQEVVVLCENEGVAALLGQDALLLTDAPVGVTTRQVVEITDVPLGWRHLPPVRSAVADDLCATREDEDRPCADWIEVLEDAERAAKAHEELLRLQLPLPLGKL